MKPSKRVFISVLREKHCYPEKDSFLFRISPNDPTNSDEQRSFFSSPLFSISNDGNILPDETSKLRVSFFIIPKVYPDINQLLSEVRNSDAIWFSLGLANIIVIEKIEDSVGDQIDEFFRNKNNFIGRETWDVIDNKIASKKISFVADNSNLDDAKCNLKIPANMPMYLEFCVCEYIRAADQLLQAAKVFTPSYFEKYKATIFASNLLVQDICFLTGNKDFQPSEQLLNALNSKDTEEAFEKLTDQNFRRQKEELLNIKHAMLVQFNSSISYLNTQAYAGVFPILEHHGLINRHSLLGVGVGVSALFELIIQLEQTLVTVPFENLKDTDYSVHKMNFSDWLDVFPNLSSFDTTIWHGSDVYEKILNEKRTVVDNDGFYHRLAFFSGRLGFREHEFAATAAIQVLAEAHSLKWNIINYTHEIIHNHVRILLNNLLLPIESITNEDYENWLTHYRGLYLSIHTNPLDELVITYKDYFTLVLINFAFHSHYYGALNRPSNQQAITELRTSPRNQTVRMLSHSELKEKISHVYRDIVEIFVHLFDFIYVYKKQHKSYLLSIWISWSTIPSVTTNLHQYILRTLVVIGIDEPGDFRKRFEKAIIEFQEILKAIREKLHDKLIVENILHILADPTKRKDLQFRFYNCIVVGDLVKSFFIGNLDKLLDNDDENRLNLGAQDENGNPISYALSTGSFDGREIKSKARFVLDQLEREVIRLGEESDNETQERISAWLLLSLATINNNS